MLQRKRLTMYELIEIVLLVVSLIVPFIIAFDYERNNKGISSLEAIIMFLVCHMGITLLITIPGIVIAQFFFGIL